MTKINSDKIRDLAFAIAKLCDGHTMSEIMTAVTMVSAFLAHDAMEADTPAGRERFVAVFANTLRLALNQDQDGVTLQ